MPRRGTQNTELRTAALRLSYTLLAPFYDWVARPAFVAARKQSLAQLPCAGRCHVLLNGIGTGLDRAHLPRCHHYLDKFLRPGARAPVRRLVSPLAGRVVTRTDVVFEEVLATVPQLSVTSDEPALAAGWFRRIRLVKS